MGAPERLDDAEREALANLIPLGFDPARDGVNNVYEAADRILASDWLAERVARAVAEKDERLLQTAADRDRETLRADRAEDAVRGFRSMRWPEEAHRLQQQRNEARRRAESAERAVAEARAERDSAEHRAVEWAANFEAWQQNNLAQAWDEGWQRGAWDVEENGWEPHDLSKGPHPANPYRADREGQQ